MKDKTFSSYLYYRLTHQPIEHRISLQALATFKTLVSFWSVAITGTLWNDSSSHFSVVFHLLHRSTIVTVDLASRAEIYQPFWLHYNLVLELAFDPTIPIGLNHCDYFLDANTVPSGSLPSS